MAGAANFPTALDDGASLGDVTDNVTAVQAAHHNNIRAAVEAIEAKVGIINTAVPTSLDYRIGHPTGGHTHDGASGMGPPISLSATAVGATMIAHPTTGSLYDFLVRDRIIVPWFSRGSAIATSNFSHPFALSKTMQIESITAVARRGPSGATAAFDINFGPTSIWVATQANRIILVPGASTIGRTSFNYVTYPSGAIITVDADNVGSSAPTEDLTLVFTFRE